MAVFDRPIDPHKAAVVEWALTNFEIASVADLGACWGVHAGYLWHALELAALDRAVVVDGKITDLSRERGARFEQVEYIEAALGEQVTVDKVGDVDAAIMYDILLHQVSPDWPEFLERYSKRVDTLIIHNQCWRGEETIRFPDMSVDDYVTRVYQHDEQGVREWYERHDDWHEAQQRPWRDVHNFWQWGITTKDLVGTLWDLGYAIEAFENAGPFDPRFEDIEALSIVAHKR